MIPIKSRVVNRDYSMTKRKYLFLEINWKKKKKHTCDSVGIPRPIRGIGRGVPNDLWLCIQSADRY